MASIQAPWLQAPPVCCRSPTLTAIPPLSPTSSRPLSSLNFVSTIKNSNAVLFVTPENSGTIPACLKNAVDIGSKPNDDVVWKNLPAAIMNHTVGRMGSYSTQKNLRLALSYLDMPAPGQPGVFLSQSPTLFDEAKSFIQDATIEFLQGSIRCFVELVETREKAPAQ